MHFHVTALKRKWDKEAECPEAASMGHRLERNVGEMLIFCLADTRLKSRGN